MSLKIGFVVLTHNKPQQAMRLVNRLNYMFGDPPIAWHNDFTQCRLPLDSVGKNITWVPPVQTAWAKFSVVEAVLRGLQILLSSKDPPDWYILVSGSDYPIRAAEKIADDLSKSEYDAHILHERICSEDYEKDWPQEHGYRGFGYGNKVAKYYDRYFSITFRFPFLNNQTITTSHPLVAFPFTPFSEAFSCFAGEHWFSANRKAVECLVDFHSTKTRLADHYRKLEQYNTIVPEESYFHTILCNSTGLKISKNHWRYIDWSQGAWHPKVLLTEDLPKMLGSTAHFARKFDADIDEEILDALDAVI